MWEEEERALLVFSSRSSGGDHREAVFHEELVICCQLELRVLGGSNPHNVGDEAPSEVPFKIEEALEVL